jgi:hypothetical protein
MSPKLKTARIAVIAIAALGVTLASVGSTSAAERRIVVVSCAAATPPIIEGSHDAAAPGQAQVQQSQAGATAGLIPTDIPRPLVLSSPCGHRR